MVQCVIMATRSNKKAQLLVHYNLPAILRGNRRRVWNKKAAALAARMGQPKAAAR